jgi:hypothetical protein
MVYSPRYDVLQSQLRGSNMVYSPRYDVLLFFVHVTSFRKDFQGRHGRSEMTQDPMQRISSYWLNRAYS